MNKKLQVFVSSTYTDLIAERQASVEAILRAGHIPAGMELFAAGDESQLETIRRWISDSDVFMLVLGGRYGSIEPSSGKSYVELEYEFAAQNKKPLFAAVISDKYLEAKCRAEGPTVIEKVHNELLTAFRKTVTSKICRFFGDPNELKVIVFESLANMARNEAIPGWVRGTEIIDPKSTLEEASRLQSENANLRSQLEDLQRFLELSAVSGQENVVASLTEDAKELLVSAKNGDGIILYLRYSEGASIQAANQNFINPENNPREEARWKAALDELIELRLVEDLGYKGETFRLTKLGYDFADEIESGRIGKTSI